MINLCDQENGDDQTEQFEGLVEVDREPVAPGPVEYFTYGGAPAATHNYLCPCCVKAKAVLVLSGGSDTPIFEPCWACQTAGFKTVRATGWKKWVLKQLGLIGVHR